MREAVVDRFMEPRELGFASGRIPEVKANRILLSRKTYGKVIVAP